MSAPERSQTQPFEQIYRDTADFLQTSGTENATMLFSHTALADRVALFRAHFTGTTTYAVKANPESRILQALYANGITEFDAASLGEIRHLLEELPSATINYNNPVRTPADTARAYDLGVRAFAVDDHAGLEQLASLGQRDIEVTIRLKLAHENAAYDFGSKFGATADLATSLLRAASDARFDAISMTFHPGSQCSSVEVYEKYIDACAGAATAAGLQLQRLNVGGGFPVPYADEDIPSLEAYFAAIEARTSARFGAAVPALLCEPGRALVGPSCALLARVIHVRQEGPVFLNDGFYGSLQEQSLLHARLPLRVWRNGKVLPRSGPERSVFGPTCDPADTLVTQYQLVDDIAVGDWVEFGLMGAYSTAIATGFNGIEPTGYALVSNGFVPDSR